MSRPSNAERLQKISQHFSRWEGLWVLRNGLFAQIKYKNSKGFWVGWILKQHEVNWIKHGKKAWDGAGNHVRKREWDLMTRKRGDKSSVIYQGTRKEWPIL